MTDYPKSTVVGVRLEPYIHKRISQAAQKAGKSLSAWLRALAMRECKIPERRPEEY